MRPAMSTVETGATELPNTQTETSEVAAETAAANTMDDAHHAAPEAATDAEAEGEADESGGDAEGGADVQAAAGTGKRKRRRRKKKKDGAAAAGEGGAEVREARPAKPERERPPFGLGDIVFGKVIEVTTDILVVDLSGKATGLFDLRELLIPEEEAKAHAEAAAKEQAEEAAEATAPAEASTDAAAATDAEANVEDPPTERMPDAAAAVAAPQPTLPRVVLEPGAQFVGVVHNDGARGGAVVLTHHPQRFIKAKPIVAQASKDGSLVFGIVTGVIKGGVDVDIDGLRAFAPASHMDARLGADLSHLVGKRLPFAVTQYGKRGRDVVLSRKAMVEAEAKAAREEALKNVKVGEEVDGVVRTVVTFGAFIDIGGVEGLVPLSEMSHNRSDGPSDVFQVGQTTRVKIMRIDERNKIWLSRKATLSDPWGEIATKYALGTKHTGTIVRVHPAGAFVQLEAGIDGMLRQVDLVFMKEEERGTAFKEGAEVEVVIAHFDSQNKKIGLYLVATGEQANEEAQKVAANKVVNVAVVSAESHGLIVRILGVQGWMSKGYIGGAATGQPRGTELRKHYPAGKVLEAKITDIDSSRNEVKLSIKAMHEETERSAYQQYRQQLKQESKFGTFGDLLAKRNARS
jgi:small subunit ribosomal protein S1